MSNVLKIQAKKPFLDRIFPGYYTLPRIYGCKEIKLIQSSLQIPAVNISLKCPDIFNHGERMPRFNHYLKNRRFIFVSGLIVGISMLHYLTGHRYGQYHGFYGQLYLLPLILAGLWSGLRGALGASIGVSALYIPFLVIEHHPFDNQGFDRILGITVMTIASIILGILSDRRMAHEKELKESERLAAIGKTVIAVAHEMQAPLIAISGFTMQVKKRLIDELCVEKLETVLRECRRLETLSREMLDISRPPTLNRTKEDPRLIAEKCADIANNAVYRDAKIRIKVYSSPDLPRIFCDLEHMERVLIDLLINAIHASAENGVIRVKAHVQGKLMFFDIDDAGPGIPEEIRERMFNLFFTTKKQGTGLGLPIARKIVRAHGGDIIHLNNKEGGSTFRVMLPLTGQR